jgi:glucosamine--fructose-6-phosphate aminotransferase (isomerizing)
MCGIVAYIGKRPVENVLIEGLKSLEYRGYDSAGLALQEDGKITLKKVVGRVKGLNEKKSQPKKWILGIAHTRWATHGKPSIPNAHPHHDCQKNIYLVHNGIIENYLELKKELQKRGHEFYSQTDTEVLAHLVEENYKNKKSLENAVAESLQKVKGTYGIAVISKSEPGKIVAAKMASPLLVGFGQNEFFIASDASAILKYTNKVVYLNDGEMAIINKSQISPRALSQNKAFYKNTNINQNASGKTLKNNFEGVEVRFQTIEEKSIKKSSQTLEWSLDQSKKGGFAHFMIKEIFEEPEALRNTFRGRLVPKSGDVILGIEAEMGARLKNINRIIFCGCGTAYLAGLYGKYIAEDFLNIEAKAELASEFRYQNPVIGSKDLFVVVSQSGETADTLAALRLAKERGAITLGIVNVVGSTISRETDGGIFNHIGPEISVASTKAFLSQIGIINLLVLMLAKYQNIKLSQRKTLSQALVKIPEQIEKILKKSSEIKKIAQKYKDYKNFLYLGRTFNYPIAFEGALKLKEISYIHAEGCGAGEMKHGPIAMIDENFPTLAIVPQGETYEKMISNIQEIKARNGKIIALATEGDKLIGKIADDVFYIPKTVESLTPLLNAIPIQLLAYYVGVSKGYDVDKPRNLAKSVTVE